jgi:methylated-DNA-protein-cysteine methyltransferase related protein
MPNAFFREVYRTVGRIPRGRVVTYGQIALALGRPGGARTVGWAMAHCPPQLPWHRVVNAKGKISPRDHDSEGLRQRTRLEEEGVAFCGDTIDLVVYGWDGI